MKETNKAQGLLSRLKFINELIQEKLRPKTVEDQEEETISVIEPNLDVRKELQRFQSLISLIDKPNIEESAIPTSSVVELVETIKDNIQVLSLGFEDPKNRVEQIFTVLDDLAKGFERESDEFELINAEIQQKLSGDSDAE